MKEWHQRVKYIGWLLIKYDSRDLASFLSLVSSLLTEFYDNNTEQKLP